MILNIMLRMALSR